MHHASGPGTLATEWSEMCVIGYQVIDLYECFLAGVCSSPQSVLLLAAAASRCWRHLNRERKLWILSEFLTNRLRPGT